MGGYAMRKMVIFAVWASVALSSAPSHGGNFAPNPLSISAPSMVRYGFNGDLLKINFTIYGVSARVTLLIFTKGQPAAPIRNGYLGWHAVSCIDTCVYMSAPRDFQKGSNIIEWNGKDNNGKPVPEHEYTFYLWGYDASSPGVLAAKLISPQRFAAASFMTHTERGIPISNPSIIDALPYPTPPSESVRVIRNMWILGNDPEDPSLMGTTAYTTVGEAPRLALDPGDFSNFFTESSKTGTVSLRKWKWTPNGEAELVKNWGNNGEVEYPSSDYPFQPPFGGLVSDGADLLFFPYVWPIGDEHRIPNIDSGVACVNVLDGTLIKKIDLSPWWSSPPDAVDCPGIVEYRNSMLFVTSPSSCLVQMVDPYAEESYYLIRWENGIGDGVWDKQLLPDSPHQTWACLGSDLPPNPSGISPDNNLFSLFPATGLSGVSFGLFAPDGTGVGYFTIPGMENGDVRALRVIDYGSAYDGIYFSRTGANGDSTGILQIGCDSAKGMIYDYGEDFFLRTSVRSPSEGEVLKAGAEYYITWETNWVTIARIELSVDGGVTWRTIADNIDAQFRVYRWIVPDSPSTECLIRVAYTSAESLYFIYPSKLFTISGSSSVSDHSDILRPFVTVSNHPNPFNPATTIRYELGAPGRVTLAVYNAIGQLVRKHDLGQKGRGAQEFAFDGSGLPSGVYFFRIDAGYASASGRMLLLR